MWLEATGFQFASTALTVTVNAVPAVNADGMPVLPDAVPGAAASPGISNCNFVKGPALTVKVELISLVNPLALAVNCLLPAVSMRRLV